MRWQSGRLAVKQVKFENKVPEKSRWRLYKVDVVSASLHSAVLQIHFCRQIYPDYTESGEILIIKTVPVSVSSVAVTQTDLLRSLRVYRKCPLFLCTENVTILLARQNWAVIAVGDQNGEILLFRDTGR